MWYRSREIVGGRGLGTRRVVAVLVMMFSGMGLYGQPADYFAGAYGLTGEDLKLELRGIIDGHTVIPYTPGIWDAHKDLYEDPDNPDNLILFYSQASWSKAAQDPGSGSEQYWNREHLWPNSYGIDGSGPAYSDLFHVVPANKAVNNDRSNNYFDYADPDSPGYEDPAHALAPECKEISNVSWEPGDSRKGWVGRAILYMTTRYSHLELVDTPPSPSPDSSSNRMAQLSVMLEWNRRFPPSDIEQTINDRIHADYQHNRNPYIDFPEFADAIWIAGASWGSWRLQHFSLSELMDPGISGDLADPDGDFLTNLMEMALYSDPRNGDADPPIDFLLTGSGLELVFVRAADFSHLNLELLLESSSDMEGWSAVPMESSVSFPDGPEQESVHVPIQTGPEAPKFYRLRAFRP